MELLADATQASQFLNYLDHVGINHRALGVGYVDPKIRKSTRAARVSVNLAIDLMEAAAVHTNKPHFALEFVDWLNPRSLGVLSLICDHCSTLDERIQIERRYLHLANEALFYDVLHDDEEVMFVCDILPLLRARSSQFMIGLMALSLKISRIQLGEGWSPVRLDLNVAGSETQRKTFRKILRCDVRFGAERNALIIRREDYERQVRTPNPDFIRFIEDYFEVLSKNRPREIETLVAQLISAELPGGAPNLVQVASRLAMTGRTLQRKLKERGTTFGAILGSVRAEIAESLLAQTPRPSLGHLAYCLGYSEPSAASRFIKGRELSRGVHRAAD